MWSPEIATTYGENYWTSMGTHPLPDHIVKRFAGKVIAITGYEQDQVMVEPVGQPGVNPEQDVSVPINWAYNHHYMTWMVGAHGRMAEVVALPNDTSAHGAPTKWVVQDLPSAKDRLEQDAPTGLLFSEGNGGESRKSFHVRAAHAAVLHAPPDCVVCHMRVGACRATRTASPSCSSRRRPGTSPPCKSTRCTPQRRPPRAAI